MEKNFKLKPGMISEKEIQFINSFAREHDKSVLRQAMVNGIRIDELKELGIDPSKGIPINKEGALFARGQYKCSHKLAKRIATENFDDDQIDIIIMGLLLPRRGFSEEKVLSEILYAKYSVEEMMEWLLKNQ